MQHELFVINGAQACAVCKGCEGSLASECPGAILTDDQVDAIYLEKLDFKGGQWIEPGKPAPKPRLPIWWQDPGGCSSCRHCGMDMDLDPYCAHPKVIERRPFGLGINAAIRDFCGRDGRLVLREERARENAA